MVGNASGSLDHDKGLCKKMEEKRKVPDHKKRSKVELGAFERTSRWKKWESARHTCRKLRRYGESELNKMEISTGIFISCAWQRAAWVRAVFFSFTFFTL